ncbi:MAG TPA: hypothetical protein VMU50_13520 [Polyangia bacterium]|nr:hypothetical protein [Polyangia bacterium]
MRFRIGLHAAAAVFVLWAPRLARGQAAESASSLVYPIYASQPDAPFNDLAQGLLARAAERAHLLPLETIDISRPPPPQVASAVKLGKERGRKLQFDAALQPLDQASSAVAGGGGAGLSTDELSDLFLFRGMATARADWKPERSVGPDTQARAYADYLRAVTLTPTRALNPRETPPQVMEDWARALAEVHARPQGAVTVRGPADATVSFDGAPAVTVGGAGAIFKDVVYGEHLIRVAQVGYAPWGAAVVLDRPSLEVPIPARPVLVLDNQEAGAHARRMGPRYAIVGEVMIGAPSLQMELRLIDVTGIKHEATVVPIAAEPGTIDAAIGHLVEQARRIEHLGVGPSQAGATEESPPPPPPPPPTAAAPAATSSLLAAPAPRSPRFGDDPAEWTRHHWPLVIAVGSLVVTSLAFSIAVAANR